MKIIFHPAYDSGYYAEQTITQQPIGTKIVGTSGLLETLEVHSGLSGSYPTDGERIAEYMKAVDSCKEGLFFKAAFLTDAYSVARKLLQWRDRLVMAGWNAKIQGDGESPKLQALRLIEQQWQGQLKGMSDRWSSLLTQALQYPLLRTNDVIECRCHREQLPYLVAQVLDTCHATYPTLTDISDDWKKRVTVHHYQYQDDIYRLVASQPDRYADTVMVNRDNVSLNHMLYAQGQPLVNATIQHSNPQALQLFKLALCVFSRPLNINNLIAYLRLPVGPIPSSLRWKLANILTKEDGFGEPQEGDNAPQGEDLWDQTIAQYLATEENKKTSQAATFFLSPIKNTDLNTDLPLSVVKDYIDALVKWLRQQNGNPDDRVLQQLHETESLFHQLKSVLGDKETILYAEIDQHVRSIYTPISIRQSAAQVGSLKVVSDLNQLVDSPQHLLWLDCTASDSLPDEYEFLNSQERTWLQQQHICLPDYSRLLACQRQDMMQQLSRITGNIIFCEATYHHNQLLQEHPLLAELRMSTNSKPTEQEGPVVAPQGDAVEVKTIQNQLEYQLEPITYEGRQESYTSIDLFINYPFDYMAQHVAKLYEPSTDQQGTLDLIKGNVAHHVFQQIIEQTKGKENLYQAMRQQCEPNAFHILLEQAVNRKGLTLLLLENELEYKNFTKQLQRSFLALIDIMEYKQLTPQGCEMQYDTTLPDMGSLGARIDMVLTTRDDHYVVFDFKWSNNLNKYRSNLEANTSIQLELYRQSLIANGCPVVAVGYYLMPLCKLFTTDMENYQKGEQILIEKVDRQSANNLFDQIRASYQLRMDQLHRGLLEEGECEEITDLEYPKTMLDGSLYPIGEPSGRGNNKRITKKSQYGKRYKQQNHFTDSSNKWNGNPPANEKDTTYPILKGRLK